MAALVAVEGAVDQEMDLVVGEGVSIGMKTLVLRILSSRAAFSNIHARGKWCTE